MKSIHFHIGPHATGAQEVLSYLEALSGTINVEEVVPVMSEEIADIALLCADGKTELARNLLQGLADEILTRKGRGFVISSENFCGELPGKSNKRKIYPKLHDMIELLRECFTGFDCYFYFFTRSPALWAHAVYQENLRTNRKFASFERFKEAVKLEEVWETTLRRCRNKLGAHFIEVEYEESPEFDPAMALMRSILRRSPHVLRSKSDLRESSNGRQDDEVLERLNRSAGSDLAVSRAKQSLGFSGALPKPAWSVVEDYSEDGLEGLAKRAAGRFWKQNVNWLVPEISFPLGDLWHTMVPSEEVEFPDTTRATMEGQVRILRFRMRGLPEPCFILGLLISYLRRDTPHTATAMALFVKMWEHEHTSLLAYLPTRWLISTLQTFLDHGQTGDQRLVGAAGYFFANIVKAYEAERALDGLNADKIYDFTVPNASFGGVGLDRFDLGRTDMLVNTLSLLYEVSLKDNLAGRVVRELLLRIKSGHTLFSRMDQSRIAHGIEQQGFANCWSFFVDPRLEEDSLN
jgi:hypothetical protein